MARIVIPLSGRVGMPARCIVCGRPECELRRITIRPSVGAGGLVALAQRDRSATVSLTLPLCGEHRGHFSLQTWLRAAAIAAVVLLGFAGLVLLAITNQGWIIPVVVVLVLAVVAVWFAVSMNVNRNRVHISRFTGDTVHLSNVAPQFAELFRQAGGDAYEH